MPFSWQITSNSWMNKKGNLYVRKMSFCMANPGTCSYRIKPLSIQRRTRNYNVDKTTAVFSFQRLVFFFFRLSSVGICHKKLWILLLIWHWEHLSTQKHTKHLKTKHPQRFFQKPMWNIAQPNSSIKPKLGRSGDSLSL